MRDPNVVLIAINWDILNVAALHNLPDKGAIFVINQATMRRIVSRETAEGCLPGAADIPHISKPQKHCCSYY